MQLQQELITSSKKYNINQKISNLKSGIQLDKKNLEILPKNIFKEVM